MHKAWGYCLLLCEGQSRASMRQYSIVSTLLFLLTPIGGDREDSINIMKRLLLTLVVIFYSTMYAQAQSQSTETVYLKNGSAIKGNVIEMIPSKQIKIQTADGSIFVYTIDEVDKITKEENSNNNLLNLFKNQSHTSYKTTGFRGAVEFGYVAGDLKGPELTFSLGGQINPYLFIGAGSGLQYLTDLEKACIPVFADIKGYLLKGSITPYVSLKIGYKFPLYAGLDGGFYCSPTVGVRAMTTNRSAIILGIGFSSQKIQNWRYSFTGNGFTIKLGYEF